MLAKITVALFFLLLVWGNLVAGLGYGLACPDWPLCYGRFIPPLRIDVFMEWMHRNLGAVASIFLLILSYKRFRSYSRLARLIPVVALVLIVFQILLGARVVLLELPVNTTTIHFGVAIVIFSIVFYMAYFDGEEAKPAFRIGESGSAVFFALSVLVFAQAVLGAYVRHSDAGLACPDFPTCLGYWIPPRLTGEILIHFSHRTLAYIIFIIVTVTCVLSYSNTVLGESRSNILILLGLVLFQIILGFAVVHTGLYFPVTAIHLSVALIILLVALYAWFKNMSKSRV